MTELKPLVHKNAKKSLISKMIEEMTLQLKGLETAKGAEILPKEALSSEAYKNMSFE